MDKKYQIHLAKLDDNYDTLCGVIYIGAYYSEQSRRTKDITKVTCKNCLKKAKKLCKYYEKKLTKGEIK